MGEFVRMPSAWTATLAVCEYARGQLSACHGLGSQSTFWQGVASAWDIVCTLLCEMQVSSRVLIASAAG